MSKPLTLEFGPFPLAVEWNTTIGGYDDQWLTSLFVFETEFYTNIA